MPSWRASSRISRLGYMPGSWVSTPARKCAGQCALSQADWYVGSANAAAWALQNPNDANASSTFQIPSTTGELVAAGQRPGEEPPLRLGHPLDVAERAALLVGLGVADAGEQRDHLDHLLVEDHHALGLPEDRAQVVVEVRRWPPALLRLEVRRDHVALDRPGPEQRDVGDDVLEAVDAGLADQLALPGRLDLEDAEGLGRRDHPERRLVVEGDLRLVVEVDLHVVDPLDLGERVRHRGLHADAEHVELEQAEVLHVVLVELAHREAGVAGLHRRPVEQGGVGEQHPARVDGDVAGQPVEPLDQPEHQVEPFLAQTARPQLRQLAQRRCGRRGPGCAGTPWRSRRSRRAASRARPRRRARRAGPGRCPSSRRSRSARRCSGRGSARRPPAAGPTRRPRRCRAAPAAAARGTAP